MKGKKINIDQLNKRNFHQVPQRYFDELPMRIQAKIGHQSAQSETTWIAKWAWQLGAAVVILSFGLYVFYPVAPEFSTEDLLAQVTTEDIIIYLEAEDISEIEISSVVELNGLILDDEVDFLDILNDEISETDLESIYADLDIDMDVL